MKAEGWDAEKIIDATAESKRVQSNAWNIEVNAAARQIAEEMIGTTVIKEQYNNALQRLENAQTDIVKSEEKLNKLGGDTFNAEEKLNKLGGDTFDAVQRSKNTIFQFIWDANDHKDELFKFKLWALELDFVKSADKTVKSSLRKAKTIIDGLVILKSIK